MFRRDWVRVKRELRLAWPIIATVIVLTTVYGAVILNFDVTKALW